MDELKKYRNEIDEIDKQITELFEKRMDISKEIAKIIEGEIKKNNRVRLSIHTLIEQLLVYNQPIIATDLEGWPAVELIIKAGVPIVSSEAISPSNDMLLPVERKKVVRLHQMYETFR